MKGYTTHNILSAVGYKPSGNKVGAPAAHRTPQSTSPEIIQKKSSRLNYVSNKPEPARLAPGVVKLTIGDPTGYRDLNDYQYQNSENFNEALVVAAHMYEQSQMPHQWVKEPLPEDNSGNEIEEYFSHISGEQFESKVEALRQQGFTNPQINAAVGRMREAAIDKALKAPFMRPGGIPSVLSVVHQRRGRKADKHVSFGDSSSVGSRVTTISESPPRSPIASAAPPVTPRQRRIARTPRTQMDLFRTPGAVAARLDVMESPA